MRSRFSFPLSAVAAVAAMAVTAVSLWSSPKVLVAQSVNYSLNFERIRFVYSPRDVGPSPFGVDLTLEPDGRLNAAVWRIHKSTNVTLKRGVFGRSPSGTLAQWEGRIESDVEGKRQAIGDLRVELAGDIDDPDADQSIEFEVAADTDDGEVEFDLPRPLMTFSMPHDSAEAKIGVGIQFDAAPEQQLRGSPADLFNSPRPGEPLIGRLPKPEPGKTIELELKVEDAATVTGGIQVPITLKHNL